MSLLASTFFNLQVSALLEQLKQAYRAFTNGQFVECRTSLDNILTAIPLVPAGNNKIRDRYDRDG